MGKTGNKVSYKAQCQKIIHEYQDAHPGQPYELDEVAAWALETKRMEMRPVDMTRIFARDLQKAARDEYFTDPQGRRVRRNHARRVTMEGPSGQRIQKVFWDDIYTAPPEHMRVSLQQRRTGIAYDCKQHNTDTESYNDNNIHGEELPLFDYDFNKDLEEMSIDPTYPTKRPEDEDIEGDDVIDDDDDGEGGVLV